MAVTYRATVQGSPTPLPTFCSRPPRPPLVEEAWRTGPGHPWACPQVILWQYRPAASSLHLDLLSLTFPLTPTSIHLTSPPPPFCANPLDSQSALLAPVESLIVSPYDHSSTGCCPLLHSTSHPLVKPDVHHRQHDLTFRSRNRPRPEFDLTTPTAASSDPLPQQSMVA